MMSIGHNHPTITTEELHFEFDDLFSRYEELVGAAAERLPTSIMSDEENEKVVEYVKQVGVHTKKMEEARKAVKQPFLDSERVIDKTFNDCKRKLDEIKKMCSDVCAQYMAGQKEAADAEADDLEDKAEGALDKAGEDPDALNRAEEYSEEAKAKRTKGGQLVRTMGGARASVKTVDVVTIPNYSKVDLIALRPYIKQEEVLRAAKAAHKAGVSVAGTEIEKKNVARIT